MNENVNWICTSSHFNVALWWSVQCPYEVLCIKFLRTGYEWRAGDDFVTNLLQGVEKIISFGAELHPPVPFVPQVWGWRRFLRDETNFIEREPINNAAIVDIAFPHNKVRHRKINLLPGSLIRGYLFWLKVYFWSNKFFMPKSLRRPAQKPDPDWSPYVLFRRAH